MFSAVEFVAVLVKDAKKSAERFKLEGMNKILELGGGQGRDSIFFAKNGLRVLTLEYTKRGVEAIKKKAEQAGLSKSLTVKRHDLRKPLPFDNGSFDACYSHMLYCMALTTRELESLVREVRRVLKPHGLSVYTVRNTDDKHYGKGIHRGEDLYEVDGFIVHFSAEKRWSI
jgi:SAM-dependent methyltransferase